MDDNQCRTCLSDALESRLSLFKKINGVALEEKLQFVTGLLITKDDSFSKLLCKKCFTVINTAYAFKTKCLDTDRILKSLEKTFQTKLKEKVQEIIAKTDLKEEYVQLVIEDNQAKNEQEETYEEEIEFETVFEDESEALYEVEYLEESDEPEATQEIEQIETFEEIVKVEKVENFGEVSSSDLIFDCSSCKPNQSFRTEIGLKKHKWEVHQTGSINPLTCQTCNYSFDTSLKEEQLTKLMRKHKNAHEHGKSHNCSFCPEVFKTPRTLEDHQSRHLFNNQRQIKCRSCQNEFASQMELQAHIIMSECKMNREKPFKCFICNENFPMGIVKKRHIQTEHKDKAGADCPLCLRCKIPSAVAFENHLKTHFAEPRFYCNYCARPFYESDRLQTHIKRAHENLKFACDWCERTFRDKSGIARHILGVHFNQRNHVCNICSKAFTASYNLKEHLFSVHKEASKFYTCETCSQDFLYRKQYERHRENCNGIPEKRKR